MLRAREEHGIALSRLNEVPDTGAEGMVVMVLSHDREERRTVVVLNFGRSATSGTFSSRQLADRSVKSIYSTTSRSSQAASVGPAGEFRFDLEPMAGEVFMVT